jgi:hypothetical protein
VIWCERRRSTDNRLTREVKVPGGDRQLKQVIRTCGRVRQDDPDAVHPVGEWPVLERLDELASCSWRGEQRESDPVVERRGQRPARGDVVELRARETRGGLRAMGVRLGVASPSLSLTVAGLRRVEREASQARQR